MIDLSELLNNPQFNALTEEKEKKKANHRYTDAKNYLMTYNAVQKVL